MSFAFQSSDEIMAALRTNDLLTREQLEELAVATVSRADDPKRLLKHLVQRGWLTLFQYQAISQGLASELKLGPYRILDRLGKGGVSSVYKAWDTKLKRNVALKVIHPDLESNVEAFGRLQREMGAATRLNHPNVVKAYDIDLTGRKHYFAMEIVEGTDLQKLVQLSGPLPVPEACAYIRQAALGLQHAFELGLVHRDIKPGNLVLLEGGKTIKVLDFGLARLQFTKKNDVNLTVEGSVIGSADYLAPEQSRNPSGVDIRADIYSLGCTLFYLLCGEVPFPGGSAFLKIHKHQTEEPTPPLEVRNPNLPEPLVGIVKKMMAKQPDDRYRTPAAVAAALAPFARPTASDINLSTSPTEAPRVPVAKSFDDIEPRVISGD